VSKRGFTVLEIMIAVLIIGLLSAIAIPEFAKARERSRQKACINNLRQIEAAKEQWAMAENLGATDPADLNAISDYLVGVINVDVVCPAAGQYMCLFIGDVVRCSYLSVTTPHEL